MMAQTKVDNLFYSKDDGGHITWLKSVGLFKGKIN
jgi:hypothetical protein